jgi:cysteinyl-tRNA synthetase
MKFYNNLTRELEEFKPINPDRVFVYSCGPTVYDVSHIGHARSCIVWDILYRYLKFKKFNIKWIRNITNIDDKIVARAKQLGISADKLSRIYTYEFWKDLARLNISWPDYEPRATDYLGQMFDFIQGLIDQGSAYAIDGDVYFRVTKHKNYGQLKGLTLDQLQEGLSRIDSNSKKESQLDFALWKNFPNEPEFSFGSPWGSGRPGWHLECSTMIKSILEENSAGETLDIHAGGDDLIHPHHENECAQSETLSGKPLAKYWMHNGMVMVNGAKMSKSEGNFFTIRELLDIYNPNTIRYFCLGTHYKKQINFSHEALKSAEQGFQKLIASLQPELELLKPAPGELLHDRISAEDLDLALVDEFVSVMDNDLGTAQALALIFENKTSDKFKTIIYLLSILGFDLGQESKSAQGADQALGEVMNLVLDIRAQARLNKDFKTSDLIRDGLNKAGIMVKDYRDKSSDWQFT